MKFKKTLVFLLTVLLAAAVVTGCSGKSGSSPAESGSPESKTGTKMGSKFEKGKVENDAYENKSIGLKLKLPEGWTALSDEEILAATDAAYTSMTDEQKKNYDYSKQKTVFDLFLKQEDSGMNIQVCVENMSLTGLFMGEDAYIKALDKQFENQKTAKYTKSEKSERTVAGKKYVVQPYSVEANGVSYKQNVTLRKKGNLMISILSTFQPDNEEEINKIMDSFEEA